MRASATLIVLLVLTGCGRTQPLRFPGDELENPDPFQDNAWRECPVDVQSFTLPAMARRLVDVLLVIDNSGSMGDDQAVVAANFNSFISAFRGEYVDYHLGAITTDSGRLTAPFITSTTPNVEQAFRSMVMVGSNGSATERGLWAARQALTDPLASAANRGFLRPEADLALMVLTDEPDQSDFSAETFTTFFRGLKTEPASVSMVAILGLRWYFLCEKMTDAWAYAEVARALGKNGMIVSCTSDYARRMAEMGGRIVNARCVVDLKHPISAGAPRVTLNGTPVRYNYWEPDGAHPNGTIEIDPCPPEGGLVEVIEPDCR